MVTTEQLPPPVLPSPYVRRGRSSMFAKGSVLSVLFLGIFAWWVLGVGGFIQAAFGILLLLGMFLRGNVRMPRSFVWWVLFLAWAAVTTIEIHDFSKWVSFGWRFSLYVAALAVFLYVYNASRESLPANRLVRILAGFWILTVIGGFVGMVLPSLAFKTPMQVLLPQHLISQQRFVSDLVSASTAAPRAFSGTSIHRPKAPFIYTNQWGSAYALTLPFAIAALSWARTRSGRKTMIWLIGFSVIPLVLSLDRGSWLSVGVSITYATLRMALGRDRKTARIAGGLILAGIVIGGLVLVSPLWSLILLRLGHGYGDQARAILYESSTTAVQQSPLFGYGTPISLSAVDPTAPAVGLSVGTHGQFWTIVVSHGVPGLVFFMGWWVFALLKSGRRIRPSPDRDTNARFWAHVSILAGMVQMGYYELVPWGLLIMMVAAGLALREGNRASRPQVALPVGATQGRARLERAPAS